MERQKRLQRQK
jgi:hypothetical protein